MDVNPTFMRSIEVRVRKPQINPPDQVNSLELLMKEKHDLETTHKAIVAKALNPFLGKKSLNSDKALARSKEFIVKKVHHIPVIPSSIQTSEEKYQKSANETRIITEATVSELEPHFLHRQIPSNNRSSYTSIFYAEDMFGSQAHSFSAQRAHAITPRVSRIKMQSNMNNKFTRTIAGSDIGRFTVRSNECIDDPLEIAEATLPQKFRSKSGKSPWIYSSILRTNRIFKVKSRKKGRN